MLGGLRESGCPVAVMGGGVVSISFLSPALGSPLGLPWPGPAPADWEPMAPGGLEFTTITPSPHLSKAVAGADTAPPETNVATCSSCLRTIAPSKPQEPTGPTAAPCLRTTAVLVDCVMCFVLTPPFLVSYVSCRSGSVTSGVV